MSRQPSIPGSRRLGAAASWRFGLIIAAWSMIAAQDPRADRLGIQPPVVEDLPVPSLSPLSLPGDDFPELPSVKETKPLPATGPGSVGSFVESLRGNDAVLDLILGQGRILTTREDISSPTNQALVAVGDPTVTDFVVLTPRQIRLVGLRVGTTDLSITTSTGKIYNFEIRVQADLNPLQTRLKSVFPDATLSISQIGGSIVVEGQARDSVQIARIIQAVTNYVSLITNSASVGRGQALPRGGANPGVADIAALNGSDLVGPPAPGMAGGGGVPSFVTPDMGQGGGGGGSPVIPRIINLLRVPTSQQVLLKVRVAEVNRTALRRIGANFLGVDPRTGAIVGTQIAGTTSALGVIGNSLTLPTGRANALQGAARTGATADTTVFGIFQDRNFEFMLNALRQNQMLRVLAEPNLVALSGQRASFLAGGEFPVPIPQVSASGVAPTITVSFKRFGVQLDFLPTIVDDNVIRLSVAPEVSEIDFAISTTLVAGGTPVPGLKTSKAQTTVELHPGETLAIAGLLQLDISGTTNRIPGLGDLPILGPFFSNNEGRRVEKELVVLVTPYLVEPMSRDQVPPSAGDEIKEPNDLEFYLLGRIEARTGVDARSTTNWDDPLHLIKLLHLEQEYVGGPSGFSR